MFKFSQRTIKEVLNSDETVQKYLEWKASLVEGKSLEVQSLTDWVLAIAEGECGSFSLQASVLSVIDAAIFHNENSYTSLVEKANEDCTQNLERLENQKLKDKLVRMNIQFAADPENLELNGATEPDVQQTAKIPLTDWTEENKKATAGISQRSIPAESTAPATGCTELTMEQSFAVTAFKNTINNISLDQAKELLAQYYQTILVREGLYKQTIKDLLRV